MATIESALVTGASSGLGRELVVELSRQYNIILSGRNSEELQRTTERFTRGVHVSIPGDITDKTTLDILEHEAKQRGLVVLVNNAGVYLNASAIEMSPDEMRRIMEVNFFAQANLTLKILPIFLAKKRGLIVNINSIAGKQGSYCESAYSASKHALKGFMDSLRFEVTKYGVRILDVYLGAMKTKMTEGRRHDYDLLMEPAEVARVIAGNCTFYDSLTVKEINIGRRKYEEGI